MRRWVRLETWSAFQHILLQEMAPLRLHDPSTTSSAGAPHRCREPSRSGAGTRHRSELWASRVHPHRAVGTLDGRRLGTGPLVVLLCESGSAGALRKTQWQRTDPRGRLHRSRDEQPHAPSSLASRRQRRRREVHGAGVRRRVRVRRRESARGRGPTRRRWGHSWARGRCGGARQSQRVRPERRGCCG